MRTLRLAPAIAALLAAGLLQGQEFRALITGEVTDPSGAAIAGAVVTLPLSVGYLRNPATFIWNGAIHKRFALPREGMFLQFRMEAINALNSPTFNGPAEAIATKPSFTPGMGWVGFGTLPLTQANPPCAVIASLKIIL